MLRALVVSIAIFAGNASLYAAAEPQPASDSRSDVHKSANSEQPTPQSSSAAGTSSAEDSAAENDLLTAANKSRELAGAPPLRMDASLRQAARAHALRMIARKALEHQLTGEPALLDRVAQASPLKMDRVGENLANATCATSANDVLMHSPPHRKNLLDTGYNTVGIAAVWSKGRLYVVQDFAHEVATYSAQQSAKMVGQAIDQTRQLAGLPDLQQLTPPNLDQSACSMADESRPNARLIAATYNNQKVITYTQSRPEILPAAALRLLRDPGVRQFAVGSCYARNAAYPTGMYWVAILLY